jgi:hypothetical protein
VVGKTLEPLAFQWRQSPDQPADADGMHIVEGIPAAYFGLERSAQVTVSRPVPAVKPGNIRFAHKIGRVLILTGALSADHLVWRVFVASLLRKNAVPVTGIERVADVSLHAD